MIKIKTALISVYDKSGILELAQKLFENNVEIISSGGTSKYLKENNIKCGIAIKPETPWDKIKPYLDEIDQVIVMTVEPGFGGQVFMNDQVDKIKNISNYIKSKDLNVQIEIDGGINYETGKICIEAGADILVAGSFLFNQDNLTTATNNLIDELGK